MPRFVQFTTSEGILVAINQDQIVAIVRKKQGDGHTPALTEILTSCQVAYEVVADYDEVCNQINES